MNWNLVTDNEKLARFIVFKRWIGENSRVKQDAFMPPPDLELSVTRHINITDLDIWNIGRLVVGPPPRQLYGRADVEVIHVRNQNLDVKPSPLADNHNHAHIINWPSDKHERKMRAIEIAAKASFIACP